MNLKQLWCAIWGHDVYTTYRGIADQDKECLKCGLKWTIRPSDFLESIKGE